MVVAAKSATPQPTLPGTIHTVAAEVEALGGKALACVVDLRDEAAGGGGLHCLLSTLASVSRKGYEHTLSGAWV